MYKLWKPKILLAMVIFGLSAVSAEVPKNNLIEAEVLLKSLAYDEKTGDIKIYLWQLPGVDTNVIEWNEDASDYTDEGFIREGTLSIANGGKITHRKVGDIIESGKWKLWLLGDKQKIIKAQLTPDTISLEKPALYIDTVYMQEKIICKETPKEKLEAIFVKFPGKLPFWMEVQTSMSSKGSMSSYVITYDERSPCIAQKEKQEKEAEEKIISDKNEQSRIEADELERLRAAEVKRSQSQQNENYKLDSDTVGNSTNNVSNANRVHEEVIKNDFLNAMIKYTIENNKVKLVVRVDNHYKNAKGGASISFPQFKDTTRIMQKDGLGFSTINAFPSNSKLWSGKYKKKIYSDYLLIEGWSDQWRKNSQKEIRIDIDTAGLSKLVINIRSLLVKNKNEVVLPTYGESDQQGYAVKSLVIDLFKGREQIGYYKNSRFGFSLKYPSHLLTQKTYPENGDGVWLKNKSGTVTLTPSGRYAIETQSIVQAYKETIKWKNEDKNTEITYKVQKKNWFVLSGYNHKDKTIFYDKRYFVYNRGEASNVIVGFHIEFPTKDKKKYDQLIKIVSKSFKPLS